MHKEQASNRVHGWLEGASGLSTVLAIEDPGGPLSPPAGIVAESPFKPPVLIPTAAAKATAAAEAAEAAAAAEQRSEPPDWQTELLSYKQRASHMEAELMQAMAANQDISEQKDALAARVAELEKSGGKSPMVAVGTRSTGRKSNNNAAAVAAAAAAAAEAAIGDMEPPPLDPFSKRSLSCMSSNRMASQLLESCGEDAVSGLLMDASQLQVHLAGIKEQHEHLLQLKAVEIDHLRYQYEQLGKVRP